MFERFRQKSSWVGMAVVVATAIVSQGTLDPQLMLNLLSGIGLIAVDA